MITDMVVWYVLEEDSLTYLVAFELSFCGMNVLYWNRTSGSGMSN
jgi:hypothetical protein